MKRSSLVLAGLLATGVFAVSACSSSASSNAAVPANDRQTLRLFTDSDVNVQDLWNKTLIPAYEKAHPNITLQLTSADASTDTTELAKLAGSVKAKQAPPMDVVIDAGFLPDADSAGLLLPLSRSVVPNLSNVDPSLVPGKGEMPYRGSSVVIAYNASKVSPAPSTLSDLVGWVKAHPGRFTYNSPSTGGSGQGFAQAVLDSKMSPQDVNTLVDGYQTSAESSWTPGLSELKSLTPSVYQHTYPNGNQAVLNLLSRGSIDMTPTWSDMFLSSKKAGTLGPDVKAVSISDPELPGGVSSLAVAKNSAHQKAAVALLDWVLEPTQQAKIASALSGYPAISLDKLPTQDRQQFAGLDTQHLSPFYSAQSAADMNSAWQKQVP